VLIVGDENSFVILFPYASEKWFSPISPYDYALSFHLSPLTFRTVYESFEAFSKIVVRGINIIY
jgi:hypothetical protein